MPFMLSSIMQNVTIMPNINIVILLCVAIKQIMLSIIMLREATRPIALSIIIYYDECHYAEYNLKL